MGCNWRSFVAIMLSIDIDSVCAEVPIHINFTAVLNETVKNFQLRGRLFTLHISYIVLGFLSILFMFGLSMILLCEYRWCKKKNEEDEKTMELVPHNIFEKLSDSSRSRTGERINGIVREK
uniref:Uncharacterized protein n=1 Tax=Onchocerca volvulus TaxID=6282 RepID=A0A8R1XPF9_ONCVO